MYIALVELNVFSGISVFYPFTSASAPVYPLPPPTTLVGALAYAYLREIGLPEIIIHRSSGEEEVYSPAYKLLDYIVYVSAGAEGYVLTRDIERVFQRIYMRKDYWREEHKDKWFTISVRGCVNYLDNKLYVVYVSRSIDILKYAYGITRIGRKEGHVAVNEVVIKPLKEVIKPVERSFKTIFYTPVECAQCTPANVVKMTKLSPVNFKRTTNLELEDYYIPNGVEPMICDLLKNGILVSTPLRNQVFDIVIPRSIVEKFL